MTHQVSKRLSMIATAFTNEAYIASQVMPEVPVPARSFERRSFDTDWTIPPTEVGATGVPRRIGQESSLVSELVKDHALVFEVAQRDIEDQRNQDAANSVDIVGHEVEATTDMLGLAREKRVADLVADSTNYAAGNVTTLSGTSKWSNAGSNPVQAILDAMRGMVVRPNVLVVGQQAWDTLRTNATVAKLVNRNDGDIAIVGKEELASKFDLDYILVGQTWHDAANPGQAASHARLWGNICALLRIDRMITSPRMPKPTWGFTGMLGGRKVFQWENPEPGVAGALQGKVAESCSEVVVYKSAGYLFKGVA